MKADDIERRARAAGVDPTFGGLAYRLNERHWPETAVAAIVAQARREALEEAMDVCRQHATDNGTAQAIEAAIRAMK